ncbi:thap domain-containing [Holotrichia oblita]|uniref:Thap domain-containing n=1 Tax=Holotrichia oblita TaxID=644536 RepID=A0ACB9SLK9_HOLOL|nr:thap domain-containing [Holotrichia oblita]
MVLNCVAFGCNNLHQTGKIIPFHTFPWKRPEILKLWVQAIRRENWYPSKTSRICGNHFLENDYKLKPGSTIKLLKPDAIPSVFCFPKHLQTKRTSRRILKIINTDLTVNQNQAEMMDVELVQPSTSTSIQQKVMVDVGVQTHTTYNSQLHKQQLKIKSLKQQLKRKCVKLSSMSDIIKEFSKRGFTNENFDSVLRNYFEGFLLEFLIHQKKNEECFNTGQRRHTSIMKQFAQTLHFYSPKAYNFLRQHFILPNGRSIRKWLSSLNCQPGFLQEVLDFLKEEVKRQPSLQQCALIFDSMAIRKQLLWDEKEGKFTGSVNYGGLVDRL